MKNNQGVFQIEMDIHVCAHALAMMNIYRTSDTDLPDEEKMSGELNSPKGCKQQQSPETGFLPLTPMCSSNSKYYPDPEPHLAKKHTSPQTMVAMSQPSTWSKNQD